MNISRLSILAACAFPVLACAASTTSGSSGDPPTSGDSGAQAEDSDAAAPVAKPDAEVDAGPTLKLGSASEVTPECKVSGRYTEAAKDGYDNGFYAIKITPTTYPFLAETLSYDLKNGTVISNSGTVQCDAEAPHKVGFFKVPAGAPTASPTDVQIWDAVGSGAARDEAIPKPVVIEKGEVGYALIQMVNGGAATCVYACSTGATAGAHYRSKKTASPFAWTPHAPSGNILVSLKGRPVLP